MNLLDLLDRPIAFHRPFVTLTGSINAALMLSQGVYWSRRTGSDDGSFYKSRDEWADETGLTHEQQESARKRLRALGFWKEENDRISHKVFYSIDSAILRKCLCDIPVSPNRETRRGQTVKDGSGKPGNTVSVIGAENTAESTGTRSALPLVLSSDLPKDKKARKGSGRGTSEELQAFAVEIGALASDGFYMFLKFEGDGWPKNWQAKLRQWNAGRYLPSQKREPGRNGSPVVETPAHKFKRHV